jgi:hypothetical protein
MRTREPATFDDPNQQYMLADEHVNQSHSVYSQSSCGQSHLVIAPFGMLSPDKTLYPLGALQNRSLLLTDVWIARVNRIDCCATASIEQYSKI